MATVTTVYPAKRPGARRGLGDRVERFVKPIAVALGLPCLDAQQQLIPGTPCHRRREKLNALGEKVGIR